jgi:hypothetical protein
MMSRTLFERWFFSKQATPLAIFRHAERRCTLCEFDRQLGLFFGLFGVL